MVIKRDFRTLAPAIQAELRRIAVAMVRAGKTRVEAAAVPSRVVWKRPERQGSRMSLAGDDQEHVVVVPGGLFAPTAKAGLTAAIGGNKVESDFAEQGEVAGGGAMAHSAIIF